MGCLQAMPMALHKEIALTAKLLGLWRRGVNLWLFFLGGGLHACVYEQSSTELSYTG